MSEMNDLDKYITQLKHHDWTYNYSDDHSVWRRGEAERMNLLYQRKKLDPNGTIWNTYCEKGYEFNL